MISYLNYFRIFQEYLGYRIYIMFVISLFTGFLEGFGLIAILPILDPRSSNFVTQTIEKLFSLFLIPTNTISLSIFILLVFIIKAFSVFSLYALRAIFSGKLLYKIKYNLFKSYSSIDYNYYLKRDTGHYINVINEQTNLMLRCFWLLSEIFTQFINSIFYLSFAIFASWYFGLISILVAIIFLLFFKKLNSKMKRISKLVVDESKKLTQINLQFFQSFKYLLSVNKLNIFDKSVKRSVSKLADAQMKIGFASGFSTAIREPFAIIFVLVFICINSLLFKNPIASLIAAALFFYKSINSVTLIQLNRQKLFENIASLDIVHSEYQSSIKNKENNGNKIIKGFNTEIVFENIYFKYKSNENYILNNISIIFKKNQTTAIIGESGAGKSTLIDLITLINKPTKGNIFINGLSHKEINYREWRNSIGHVPQTPFIFSDTIANNISLNPLELKNNKYLKDLKIAAKKASIHNFIESLPQKYDTYIGDGGVSLSGGQKQRICIARELYRNASLLIFDEATSSLDRDSELKIQECLNLIKGEITTIIIAHRLDTIKDCDNVLILNNGKISDFGSYEDLASKRGSYLNHILNI